MTNLKATIGNYSTGYRIARFFAKLQSRAQFFNELLTHIFAHGKKRQLCVRDSLAEDEEGDREYAADMAWSVPQFSRGQVDKAGQILTTHLLWSYERDALTIINNWRSSHSYPLQVLKMTLLGRAKKIDPNTIVAQRLKRLTSIRAKLERFQNMQLSRMQDIGGCRAVLSTVGQVDELVSVYEESVKKNPHGRPELIAKHDYIIQPKADGYRSIHYVYRYHTKSLIHTAYDGLRIEIQIRSQLQHLWATAVETVSTFIGQALKSNVGADSWKRFFVLMGSAIAMREDRPLVEGTPHTRKALGDELRKLVLQYQFDATLEGWSHVVQVERQVTQFIENPDLDQAVFLLMLDAQTKESTLFSYPRKYSAHAGEEYLRYEKQYANNPHVQIVLVSVDSLANLRRAYPNYYLDTRAFLSLMKEVISDE